WRIIHAKKIVIPVIFFVLSFHQLTAIGTRFLTIPSTPREVAMGGFSASFSGDAFLYHGNPALVVQSAGTTLYFGYNTWLAGSRGSSFLLTNPLIGGVFGFGIRQLVLTDIEFRTTTPIDEYLSLFNASGTAVELVWGCRLNRLHIGATTRWIRTETYVYDATGVGVDVGLWMPLLKNRLSVGASVQNIGTMSELMDKASELPAAFLAGITFQTSPLYKPSDSEIKSSITVSGEVSKFHGTVFRVSGEILHSAFRLTLGTRFSDRVTSVGAGVGIHWRRVEFGYGLEVGSHQLGIPHLFDFRITLP
ncbi:MAG: hypothetical protein H8E82_07020, partial [Candidatus Marinimicrobia bacterium]|nr:hypothetical protein [Candidatus Neomarinimicrobiota bacterium]